MSRQHRRRRPALQSNVVTGFNSFRYAAGPGAALQETRRVLRESGRVLMATWGRADQCDGATVLDAVAKLLPAPPAGGPGPFALAEEGALAAVLDAAGFETLVIVDVSTPLEYEDEATYLRGFGAAGPCVNAARLVGQETFDTTLAAAAPFRRDDGSYRLDNIFRFAIARTRPG